MIDLDITGGGLVKHVWEWGGLLKTFLEMEVEQKENKDQRSSICTMIIIFCKS